MSQTINTSQPAIAIASNPKHVKDGVGIWYAIQNKADVDEDLGVPAKRMSLQAILASGSANLSAKMAPIPLIGNYDAFLWRVESVNQSQGTYKLINKKYEKSLGLDNNELWHIERMDLEKMGTNAYYIQKSSTEAIGLTVTNVANLTPKIAASTKQTWIFQPMELAAGYHIPKSPPTIPSHKPDPSLATIATGAFTKMLTMDNGFTIFATETTSDWAILNVHNIHTNMMNALKAEHPTKMNAYATNARKEILISSRFDTNNAFANYPLTYGTYGEDHAGQKRGGVIASPGQPNYIFLTWVSEEMMCRTGTVQKIVNDEIYREFDQVVHEFAHSIDESCNLEAGDNPANRLRNDPILTDKKDEWFPDLVQFWFNSRHQDADKNRQYFERVYSQPEIDFVKSVFNEANTWLPPRQLRDHPFSIPTATLKSPSTYPNYLFGHSVGISQDGKTAVVGAPNRGSGNNLKGEVILFSHTDTSWNHTVLAPNDNVRGFWFGFSAAISENGDTVVVGAPRYPDPTKDHGAVYVFSRNEGGANNWGQVGDRLTAVGGSKANVENSWFGHSVAIKNTTLAIGTPDNEPGAHANRAGSVYIFQLEAGQWIFKQELTAPTDPTAQPSGVKTNGFGHSLAISDDGNTVIVGAPDVGYVYAFRRASNSATFANGTKVNDSKMNGQFGHTVAIGEKATTTGPQQLVVVGAPGIRECKAYLYNLALGTHEELEGDDPLKHEMYGWAVAISGKTIMIGERFDYHADTHLAGSVTLFNYQNDAWRRVKPLQLNAPGADHFGYSVAISQDEKRLMVGAPMSDVELTNGSNRMVDKAGVVHIYEI